MSELKEHRFITTDELFHDANAGALYYDKSEADKVIAEKDKELCRQKYKRCLAMAEICRHEWCVLYYERKKYRENPFLDHLKERKNRHREKWLEIAEQFKPNNSTAQ